MSIYLIAHELHSTKAKTYDSLKEAIMHLGPAAWHGMSAAWLVVSHKSEIEIRRTLRRHMRPKDRLLIIACDPRHASWAGFEPICDEWLQEHLGSHAGGGASEFPPALELATY